VLLDDFTVVVIGLVPNIVGVSRGPVEARLHLVVGVAPRLVAAGQSKHLGVGPVLLGVGDCQLRQLPVR